jgi:hypothetical protein
MVGLKTQPPSVSVLKNQATIPLPFAAQLLQSIQLLLYSRSLQSLALFTRFV